MKNDQIHLQLINLLLTTTTTTTQVLNHSELTMRPTNSVFAMLILLFSKPKTADVFYLNDVHVLIDIIARQLADTQPSDERRQDYLLLIENILNNGTYQGHRWALFLGKVHTFEECFYYERRNNNNKDKHVFLWGNIFCELFVCICVCVCFVNEIMFSSVLFLLKVYPIGKVLQFSSVECRFSGKSCEDCSKNSR